MFHTEKLTSTCKFCEKQFVVKNHWFITTSLHTKFKFLYWLHMMLKHSNEAETTSNKIKLILKFITIFLRFILLSILDIILLIIKCICFPFAAIYGFLDT